MGSARLVFGFGGHGQRRQRREGGGEQPPQLQVTVQWIIFTNFPAIFTHAIKTIYVQCKIHVHFVTVIFFTLRKKVDNILSMISS